MDLLEEMKEGETKKELSNIKIKKTLNTIIFFYKAFPHPISALEHNSTETKNTSYLDQGKLNDIHSFLD